MQFVTKLHSVWSCEQFCLQRLPEKRQRWWRTDCKQIQITFRLFHLSCSSLILRVISSPAKCPSFTICSPWPHTVPIRGSCPASSASRAWCFFIRFWTPMRSRPDNKKMHFYSTSGNMTLVVHFHTTLIFHKHTAHKILTPIHTTSPSHIPHTMMVLLITPTEVTSLV